MTDIHSCSYYCDRPKCIKAQRDELRDKLAQPAPHTEQEPVALDLSHIIRLTHTKTKGIIEQHKYNITGFVLTNDDGKKCISDMAAVRWFEGKDFFAMMHSTPPAQPQRKPLTEEQIEVLAIDVLGYVALREQDLNLFTQFVRAVEATHGITKGGEA